MSFYANMGETAKGLLAKFGTTVVLRRTLGGSFDPVSGIDVAGSPADVTTTGLIRPYPDSVVDGVRIISGDREVILGNEYKPRPDDRLFIGGEDWSIQNIKTVKPDDTTAVVYFVQVRE